MAPLIAVLAFAPTHVGAAEPRVQWDTAYIASSHDLAPAEAAVQAAPQERIVETDIDISALVAGNQSTERMQFMYQLVSPTGQIEIVDFQPRTEMAADITGTIGVDKKKETTKSLGLSLSGSFETVLRGTGGADLGAKGSTQIHYDLKPRQEAVLAAGTIRRGTGVYFKLRSSADSTLEGTRRFTLRMRVAADWRGDVIYVHCRAQRQRRDSWLACGEQRFVVALCAAGDEEVRAAAEDLMLAEAALRRCGARREEDLKRRSYATVAHRVGSWLDLCEPRIPSSWLERLLFGPTDVGQHAFVAFLPPDIRREAERYGRAKRKLCAFHGQRFALAASRAPRPTTVH